MKFSTIYTPLEFEKDYGKRSWEWYKEILSIIVRYSNPGIVVDLGTGLGLLVECASRWGIPCIGLEGSEYAVQLAKERFPSLDIRCHSLEDKLPFEGNSIDTVVLHHVIEHLQEQVMIHILHEALRILKSGGTIFVFSPSAYNKITCLDLAHINLYSPLKLRNTLCNMGFVNVRSLDFPKPLFGKSSISKIVSNFIFNMFPFDRLSNSANCVGWKPKKEETGK